MLIGFVKRVTHKRLIAITPVVINATLDEVLIDRLVKQELVGREVSHNIQHAGIWQRVLVEIWSDRGMNRDGLGDDCAGSISAGKNPVTRIDVGNGCVDGSAECFSQ